MENLELQKQVINLGKLLVKELNLDPGVDTLSRWMAHYVAEKMSLAENSAGEEKEIAEKECLDTILKLWEHRKGLKSDPLRDYESIFDLLSKLNADEDEPLFVHFNRQQRMSDSTEINFKTPSKEDWIAICKRIDKVARIWIEYSLRQAATQAKREDTEEWIRNSVNLPGSEDERIIKIIIDNHRDDCNVRKEDDDQIEKKCELDKLKSRIVELERFQKLNETLIDAYKAELASKENS